MTSWVETTCPPGWGVQEESDVHWSVYCCEPGGADRFVAEVWGPMESANRLAWERWALDVLGDRVRWDVGWAGPILLVDDDLVFAFYYPGGDLGHGPPVWKVHGPSDDIGTTCHDPVEALARLAAMTLAVLGPRI